MKIISVVLVLMAFGTVCSSYAIKCMDVWDEESIAEMIEDDRQYEESLRAGHNHHDEDEDGQHHVHDEDEDEEDDDDDEEDDEGHTDEHEHDQHSESSVPHAAEKHRHQRDVPAVEQPATGQLLDEEPSDLETAETHLFRPVFRYKSQYTERRRVRTPNGGGANFAPSQS
uniref:Secreted protein n=1 Tax=Anopheles christyi TaxID=43041 RepID=A0A182K402_9DIPT